MILAFPYSCVVDFQRAKQDGTLSYQIELISVFSGCNSVDGGLGGTPVNFFGSF